MEKTLCAYCFDGLYYPTCEECKGNGMLEDEAICPKCEGSGTVAPIKCPHCDGVGEVTLAFAHILSAARMVCRNEGVPLGSLIEDKGHGITQTSLAKYYHYRQLGFKAVRAQGIVGEHEEHIVILTSDNGRAIRFSGFSYGYGGEGPTGLMWVLADSRLVDSIESARLFVTSLPQNKSWMLRKMQEA